MKTIGKLIYNCFQVTSEPGDCTLYSYFVFKNGNDFCFMPCESTFRFPQRLNFYECDKLDEYGIIQMAKFENVNPHTLAECIRTMRELMKGE